MGKPAPRLPAAPPAPHDTYEVRRAGLPPLYFTRAMLCCFFDLTLRQAAHAIGVCLTTMKKIRVWSGVGAWPHADVRRGRHAQFTLHTVEALRLGLADGLHAQGDAVILPVLMRAQALALGCAVDALAPPPPPSPPPEPAPVGLDDLDLDLSDLELPGFDAAAAEGLLAEWRPEEGALLADCL